MKIGIIALGSRGDIQPLVALGKGLLKAGHTVRFVTNNDFRELVTSNGLAFWAIPGDVQAAIQSPEMREKLAGGNVFRIMGEVSEAVREIAVEWAREALEACAGMDMIVTGIGGLGIGCSIAEKLALPLVQAHYVPFTPTSAFPSALLPPMPLKLGGWFNKLSHHIGRFLTWRFVFRTGDEEARKQVLDLPRASFWGPYNAECTRDQPVLYAFSPSVIAKPRDWTGRDRITGYWFLEAEDDWTPPNDLLAFLDAGPKPVYVGFGSMSSRDPEGTARIVLEALAKSGQRAVIVSGWGGLHAEEVPESVFMAGAMPFSWLFPRMAAVVHHGGAGTTSTGFKAGVPSIIIPFFGDQPFWGQTAADLGVGPEYIHRKNLTVDRLAKAIQTAVTDRAMQGRAAELGEKIRAEDGIGRAVEILEQVFIEREGS